MSRLRNDTTKIKSRAFVNAEVKHVHNVAVMFQSHLSQGKPICYFKKMCHFR